jgi:hypothetical protein
VGRELERTVPHCWRRAGGLQCQRVPGRLSLCQQCPPTRRGRSRRSSGQGGQGQRQLTPVSMCCGFKHCRQPPAQPAQLIWLLTRLGDAVPHCIRSLQCWTVTILADCLSYVGSMLATLLPSSPAGCLSWPRPSSQGKQQQEAQLGRLSCAG